MNHTSKRTLQFAAMILVGATFFMGGCGPENLDDPTYLADLENSDLANDAADKTDATMKPMMEEGDQARAPEGGAQAMPEGGAPEGGAPADGPAVAAVVPATPVVQLPDQFVKLPPEFRAQPPILTQSGEQRAVTQRILFEKDIHVAQPAIENHLVTTNHHVHRQYHTNVINHPSFRRDVAFAHTASASAEVLPTTVVTAPAVVTPGIVAPPVVAPAIPYCAPWFSGGLLRACGPAFPHRYPWLR